MVADFQFSLSLPLEEFIFQQEFFSTGLCLQAATGQEQGLKMFARENLQYEEHGEISQSLHLSRVLIVSAGISCVLGEEKNDKKVSDNVEREIVVPHQETETGASTATMSSERSQSSAHTIHQFSNRYFLLLYIFCINLV